MDFTCMLVCMDVVTELYLCFVLRFKRCETMQTCWKVL